MTAANAAQPPQKSSNVVPMATRPAQSPAGVNKTSTATMTPIENQPPDEPGYGHGV
jgi:hypothetical protein